MSATQPTAGEWFVATDPSSPHEFAIDTIVNGETVHIALVHIVPGPDEVTHANAAVMAAAPSMKAVLDDLEDAFDKQIYGEQVREDFDAPDDREYSVTITAKQWRAIGRALTKASQRS